MNRPENQEESTSLTEHDYEVAPCLRSGPLAAPGSDLVLSAKALPATNWADVLRSMCVPAVFHNMELVFSAGVDPTPPLTAMLSTLSQWLRISNADPLHQLDKASTGRAETQQQPVETVTGDHYGKLFEAFSSPSYWDEPRKLLGDRLERNGISSSTWAGKTVLDAGCGGGRYSVAWKLLGAASVIGIDLSKPGLADARARVQAAGIDGVQFQESTVLQLPFPDNEFDVVYSNGVLHHTVDWETGTKELVRVLKPNGLGWLYLIENPGGYFWDLIEILRLVTKDVPKETARGALRLLGIPSNRSFYMLDHVMVPINVRATTEQIERCLREGGAIDIRRLTRGTDFDRVEQIYRQDPFAEIKYGIGEHRYVFTKAD